MSPARRALTDYQWIILWEIAEGPDRVWMRDGDWFISLGGVQLKISDQVRVLYDRDLIELTPPAHTDLIYVTADGHAALAARDYMAVIDRYNGR